MDSMELEDVWEKVISSNRGIGRVEVAAVVGAEGVGKTRLVEQFYRKIASSQSFWPSELIGQTLIPTLPAVADDASPTFLWWAIRFHDSEARHRPIESLGLVQLDEMTTALNSALPDALGAQIIEPVADMIAQGLVASVKPFFSLGKVIFDAFQQASDEKPLERKAIAERERKFSDSLQLLNQALRPFKKKIPLVLVLDDFHYATKDPSALAFLEKLAEIAEQAEWNLFVIATVRLDAWENPLQGAAAPSLTELFGREARISVVQLDPATPEESMRVITSRFPGMTTAQVFDLISHVGGNRRVMNEILDAIAAAPVIFENRDLKGRVQSQALESFLKRDRKERQHLSTRLEAESEILKAFIYSAACLGRIFDPDLVFRVIAEAGYTEEAKESLLGRCVALGLLGSGSNVEFASDASQAAAMRLGYTLPSAQMLQVAAHRKIADTFSAALDQLGTDGVAFRETGRIAIAETAWSLFRDLNSPTLNHLAARAAMILFLDARSQGAARLAAKISLELTEFPPRLLRCDEWLMLVPYLRLAGRKDLISKTGASAKEAADGTRMDEIRLQLFEIKNGLHTDPESACQTFVAELEQMPRDDMEVSLLLIRALYLYRRTGEQSALISRTEMFMRKSEEAIASSSLRRNTLSYRDALDYQLLACLQAYSEVQEVDPNAAQEWLAKAEAVFSTYKGFTERHQFTPAALIAKALLSARDGLDAEEPLHRFRKLYDFDHEIDEFGFDRVLAELDSIQIDLIDQCLAVVNQLLDDGDAAWPTHYAELDGLTAQQMKTRLIMRKSRLKRRAAEVKDDLQGVVDAIEDQFIYLSQDFLEEPNSSLRSEYDKVEGGGRPELHTVFVALFRAQLDTAFRLIEKNETPESLHVLRQSCSYLVENLSDSYTARLTKFLSLPDAERHQDMLVQLSAPIEEACSVITRTLLAVRHGCPSIDLEIRQRTERSLLELRVNTLSMASAGTSLRLRYKAPQSWHARVLADEAELEMLPKLD